MAKLLNNTMRKDTIQMVKEYQEQHKEAMKKDQKLASNCAWFDLEGLMDYLRELKDDRDADGLRIYFGSHFKEGNSKGYNTIILVGTKKEGTRNVDVKPKDEKDEKAFFDFAAGDDLDNGHLCPPCDCGETILFEATGSIPGCE